jgi:peptide subunit release factor 1 (eRF1)
LSAPDLRRLADEHEPRLCYLSLYADLKKGVEESFFRKRHKECETALSGRKEALAAFREAFDRADKLLRGGSWKAEGVVIFCNPLKNYLEAFETPGEVENRLVFDSSPFIKPLVSLQHEWEEYIVIVLDHTHARIFTVAHFEILKEDDITEEIVRHHRHGGMSQMRFQRLHAGFVDHYFKEVVEHLLKELVRCECQPRLRGIVLAGPKDAKTAFEKYLPADLQKLVVGRIDEPVDIASGTMVHDAEGLITERGKVLESEVMARLRSEVLRGGLATYGFDQVREAVEEGRADILIVQAGLGTAGWRCEHCRKFGKDAPPACPSCGKDVFFVDAVEELVELALDMRTQVEFQPPDCGISELGGVAALLRY